MALHDLEHAAREAATSAEMQVIARALGGTTAMRAEAAGIAIGSYLAQPFTKYRSELLAAGLLAADMAIESRELNRWIREGFLRANGGAQSDPERYAWMRALGS
jgi:ribosomal protein S9